MAEIQQSRSLSTPAGVQAGLQDDHGGGLKPKVQGMVVPVFCGEVQGELLVDQLKVRHNGELMTGTEFERLGGKTAAKKWKQSIRVLGPNNIDEGPVQNWLHVRGIDIGSTKSLPNSSAIKFRGHPGTPVVAGMLEHYEKQNVGYRPGDPTVGEEWEVPVTFSPAKPGQFTLDISGMTDEEADSYLAAFCKIGVAGGVDPLRDLLSKPPSIKWQRQAHFQGFVPAERPAQTQTQPAGQSKKLEDSQMGQSGTVAAI